MMRRIACLAVSGAIGASGLAAAPQTPVSSSVLIALERTGCLGTCPSYTVTIDGDGNVSYVGREFVRVKGEQHGHVEPARVAALVAQFQKAGFFDLRDDYSAMITDQPTTFVALTLDGRTKRVRDYAAAPMALHDLEDAVDRVSHVHYWVGVDADAVWELQASAHPLTRVELTKYLRDAIWWDDPEIASALVAAGADVHIGIDTALGRARSPEMVRALVGAGVKPNDDAANGTPPLVSAVAFGRVEVIDALIAAGANVNGADANGRTPLMNAAAYGRVGTVEVLLTRGANARATNRQGQTALDFAAEPCRGAAKIYSPLHAAGIEGYPTPDDCDKAAALIRTALAKH